MGLSTKKQTTKESSSTQTNQQQTATTTPNVPGYAQGGIDAYYQNVSNLAGQNPYQFTAPINSLQQGSAQSAGNLGGWQSGLDLSNQTARDSIGQGPSLMGPAATWSAPQIGDARLGNAEQTSVPRIGGAVRANTPQIGQAQSWQAQGYNPIMNGPAAQAQAGRAGAGLMGTHQLGPANTYQAARLGPAAQAAGVNIGPAAQAGQVRLTDPGQAAAERASSTNAAGLISSFLNPYTQQVVDASMADFDVNAGRTRAAQAGQMAASGAFGGSRSAIREAQTEGELARARASTQAGLLSSGFNTALEASLRQAGRDTDVSTTNATLGTNTSVANMQERGSMSRAQGGIDAQIGVANAQERGAMARAQGGIDAQIGVANMGEYNAQARDQAGRDDVAGRHGADAWNNRDIEQGRFAQESDRTNANNITGVSQTNANNDTQTNISNAGWTNQSRWNDQAAGNSAAEFYTGAVNNASRDDSLWRNQFTESQFQADSAADRQFAADRNMFTGQQFGADTDAARQYTADRNAFTRDQFGFDTQRMFNQSGLDAQADSANTQAINTQRQFDAGQTEGGLLRRMQAAALLGNNANAYASNTNNDINTQMAVGNNMYALQNQQAQVPLTYAAQMAQLLNGGGLLGTVTGQTVNGTNTGTTNSQGESVVKSRGSLFDQILAAAQVAASVAPSDRRLKTNIEQVGALDDGLGVYEWTYIWGGERQRGVMADEVALLRPHALGPQVAGYATVDYGAL